MNENILPAVPTELCPVVRRLKIEVQNVKACKTRKLILTEVRNGF